VRVENVCKKCCSREGRLIDEGKGLIIGKFGDSSEAVTCPREYGRPLNWDADERPVYAIGARSLCAEM